LQLLTPGSMKLIETELLAPSNVGVAVNIDFHVYSCMRKLGSECFYCVRGRTVDVADKSLL